MQINPFTAGTSPLPITGLEIKTDATFVMFQNNNAEDYEVSTSSTFTFGTGWKVRSLGETMIPVDGNTQILYSRAESSLTACVYWIG